MMKTILHIGKVTKKDVIKAIRKTSREIELQNQPGWSSVLKVHKSEKTYTRKLKHKNNN